MNDNLWTQFEQITDHLVNSYANLTNLKVDSIHSGRTLNSIWMFIRNCIIKATKEVILYHKVANNSTQRLPNLIT